MTSDNPERWARQVARAFKVRIEKEFPDLEAFIVPWDSDHRLKGHVNYRKTGDRLLDFGDPEQGQLDLLIYDGEDELARRVTHAIERRLQEDRAGGPLQ